MLVAMLYFLTFKKTDSTQVTEPWELGELFHIASKSNEARRYMQAYLRENPTPTTAQIENLRQQLHNIKAKEELELMMNANPRTYHQFAPTEKARLPEM